MKLTYLLLLSYLVVTFSCTSPEKSRKQSLDNISQQYVELALEIGSYDEDFIDAYYGQKDWIKSSNAGKNLPYEELKWKSTSLLNALKNLSNLELSELELERYQYLRKQLEAIRTKLDIMSGKELPFDVESLRLYDVVAPHIDLQEFDILLEHLDTLVPGKGPLSKRYEEYASKFIIPKEKLDTVFRAAINEARRRVLERIDLPEYESFKLEYVTDQPWSGYNWYKGNGHSLIQINTDFPIYIERAIDLACHEGYPGHHVYNVMLEKSLVKDKGWLEYQVYPLFSPQSFIAEGTANYGIQMTFSKEDRLKFEKETLFPLAGLDSTQAEQYYQIQEIRQTLLSAEIQIARSFLNGEATYDQTLANLQKYLQYETSRAKQRIKFMERYGSYIINYSLGSQLVEDYVNAGMRDDEKTRWELYKELLSTPKTASVL